MVVGVYGPLLLGVGGPLVMGVGGPLVVMMMGRCGLTNKDGLSSALPGPLRARDKNRRGTDKGYHNQQGCVSHELKDNSEGGRHARIQKNTDMLY